MPNINLLQNTTGEESKPKVKKEAPPSYTTPPVEPKITESDPTKKLSPLGSFFGKKTPAVPSVTPVSPAKSPIRSVSSETKPVKKTYEPIQTKPSEPRRSWLGGLLNFMKPQTKITEERVEEAAGSKPSVLGEPAAKTNTIRGKRILEEKELAMDSHTATPTEPDDLDGGKPSLGVNLMPDDVLGSLEPKKKLITYLVVLVISAGIIGGGYGGLVWYENRIYEKAGQTTNEVDQVNAKIVALRPEQQKAVLFKSQTDAIGDILDKHVYWTQFFARLEKYTMPEVEYQSFAGSFTPGSNPSFSISATTNSFDSVAQQVLAFRQAVDKGDFISVALIESGNRVAIKDTEEYVVQFTLQITVLEKVFYKRIGEIAETTNQ